MEEQPGAPRAPAADRASLSEHRWRDPIEPVPVDEVRFEPRTFAGAETWKDLDWISPGHRRVLIIRGISPSVAGARGYVSVNTRGAAALMGHDLYRRRYGGLPALAIPLWAPGDKALPHGFQLRPNDSARPWDRSTQPWKPMRYVLPKGMASTVSINPSQRLAISTEAVPLYLTEGAIKADALASVGLAAVGFAGAWGWSKGHDLDPVLARIPVRNRAVRVVFDSDLGGDRPNNHVIAAAVRLRQHLRSRGAIVEILVVPAIGGALTGIDDYLAAGLDLAGLETWPPVEPTLARAREHANRTRARGARRVALAILDRMESDYSTSWAASYNDIADAAEVSYSTARRGVDDLIRSNGHGRAILSRQYGSAKRRGDGWWRQEPTYHVAAWLHRSR